MDGAEPYSATDAAHPRFSVKPQPDLRRGLKIALVQMMVTKDKCSNIGMAESLIQQAGMMGANIVALPECFNSPYGTKYFKEYAEAVPGGQTANAMACAAVQNGVCLVAGSIPESCDGKLYNTTAVWDNSGKLIATHRKMHLFDIDIPGKITFKESATLSPGNKITVFEYGGVKIGLGICYDIRFPEMAQLMGAQGCQLMIYPAAFNMTTGPKHWQLLARARANDLQAWVALVSPARDDGADYVAYGHTTLVSPWAEVIAECDEEPGMIVQDIDFEMVEEVRRQIPIWKQRRLDIYDTVKKASK